MKQITAILVCIIILSSCTKQHKAESTVTHYIKKHLAHSESYESVGFDKLRPHIFQANGDETVSDTNQLKPVRQKQDGWVLGHAFKISNGSGTKQTYKQFVLSMSCDSIIQ